MMAGSSVLLLEDDPDISGLLELVLAEDGHAVQVCESPEHVVQLASETPGALAVMDFWGRSHGTLDDGEREHILRVARTVPTVLVTGRAWAERETDAALGLAALVRKPFDVFDLSALVKGLAQRVCADSAGAREESRHLRACSSDALDDLRERSRRRAG